jgi:hypothetical protein
MDTAEIAWVVVAGVVVLVALVVLIRSIPEIRRYLNVQKM